jgi:hypothetical protein
MVVKFVQFIGMKLDKKGFCWEAGSDPHLISITAC